MLNVTYAYDTCKAYVVISRTRRLLKPMVIWQCLSVVNNEKKRNDVLIFEMEALNRE